MSYLKIAVYFLAGLLVVGGAACVGMFFMFGSIDALGGAVMFLCFGLAFGLCGFFFDQIVSSGKRAQAVRPQNAGPLDIINAERQRRERKAGAV